MLGAHLEAFKQNQLLSQILLRLFLPFLWVTLDAEAGMTANSQR